MANFRLCRQDTSPSTLDRSISSTSQAIHDAKRAKLDDSSEQTSITDLIKTRAYTAIEEVVKDLEIARASVVESVQDALVEDQGRTILQGGHRQIARAAALKREFDKLIQREIIRRPEAVVTSKEIKDEASEEADTKVKMETSTDNVLTLLASNQPPKQLFTSLQKSNVSNQPLDELALPNGITVSKVTPQHSINEDGKKPVPTLRDVFAPPTSLTPLTLPKQSRHTATRSSSVNWYNPTEFESKSKQPSRLLPNQALQTGKWVKYSVAPSPTQLASPETKRKQRDRALSGGEPQSALSKEAAETHNQAKDDALFRSVYSSFAPTRDDFEAVVPEQQKNKLWYKKYGEEIYEEILGLRDDGLAELEPMETDPISVEEPLDEKELETAIAEWQPEEPSQVMHEAKTARSVPPETAKEADELLEEISDLIETLHSHQRIRNLTNNTRSMAGQNPPPAGIAGNPTSPSAAEFDVYSMLKDQLTLIVATLPPYLLSKLDGDKLGALKVSTKIPVDSKNEKGVLEESEASAIARRAATPSAAPVAASQTPSAYAGVRGGSSNYLQASTPAQQYPRAGYGASTAPRPAASASYLQNPQYSNRPASSSYGSTSTRPTYPGHSGYPPQTTAASSTSRYNYAQQYAQQSQSSYGATSNGYRSYAGQNMNNYNYNGHLSGSQARTPFNPAQAASQPYRGTATDYQQRAVPPQGYGYGSVQGGGSASPLNQHRPSFSSQTPQGGTQQRPPLYHQHSSQYNSQTPGSPQVNGTASNGSPAPPANMTPDEQSAVMSKQKAQLAEQSSRQGSGTPQPGSRQYTPQRDGGQQNGTVVPQQNGIVAGQA